MDIKAELRSMIEVWGADFVDKAVVALAEIERLEAEVARLSEAVFRQDAAWQATAAPLRAERDALRASNERMEAALKTCVVTMKHAQVFISSREKMHRDGQSLFQEDIDNAARAIAESDKKARKS